MDNKGHSDLWQIGLILKIKSKLTLAVSNLNLGPVSSNENPNRFSQHTTPYLGKDNTT